MLREQVLNEWQSLQEKLSTAKKHLDFYRASNFVFYNSYGSDRPIMKTTEFQEILSYHPCLQVLFIAGPFSEQLNNLNHRVTLNLAQSTQKLAALEANGPLDLKISKESEVWKQQKRED